VTDLKRIFQFCVQALGELSKLVPPHSDEVLALLKHLLSIGEGVLSWGFISANYILHIFCDYDSFNDYNFFLMIYKSRMMEFGQNMLSSVSFRAIWIDMCK